MEKKGLCISCNSDKTCSFARRFPVLLCEEFSDYTNHRHSIKVRPKSAHYHQEIVEAE